MTGRRAAVVVWLALLGACKAPAPKAADDNAPPSAAAPLAADAWIGRWTGPEGLFLDIRSAEPGSGVYQMTLKDTLDGQADYEGRAAGAALGFTRAGKAETLRPGPGSQTGFKYLAGKTECLIVVAGKEGYCRD